MSTNTETQAMTAERETFLAGIIVTAIEGGIGYWASASEYRWYAKDLSGGTAEPAPNGGDNAWATVFEREDEDAEAKTLDLEAVNKAVERIASGEEIKYLGSATRSTVIVANQTNDPFPEGVYGIDADVADQIVQVALLGEVVYG